MSGKSARLALLIVSVLLAVSLLTGTIGSTAAAVAFAVALASLGIASRGFGRRTGR